MGTKMARSPSPPVEPLHDSQELQINAILQGIAQENSSHVRNRKRKRKVPPLTIRTSSFTHHIEKPPTPLLLPALPSRKELADIKKHNLDVRAEVFKAVRRPGKDFTKLFENLKQLKGGVDVKKEVIRDVINESLRFKRKALAKLLEDFLVGLEKNGSSASVSMKRFNNTVHYSNSSTPS